MSERQPCQNKECNEGAYCTCGNADCPRHGICCECVAFHIAQKKPPQCMVKAGI